MFNSYPYTNFHEINLDWLIRKVMEVIEEMDNFIALNQIKVADPIEWSLNRAYDRLTIVIHEDQSGVKAYLSVRDVPAGTALSNSDYWAQLGTVIDASILEGIREEIAEDIEELRTELTAELNAAVTQINADMAALRTELIGMLPVSNHNRMTYYIDAAAGSDDNDGLTQETAFKTFDRFMNQADKYASLHGRIVSAGTYTYSNTEIANLDLDVQALVDGVTLVLTPDPTDGRFTFYNGRMNFYGAYGATIPMVLRISGDGIIYMIGCTSAIHDIVFVNSLCVYGGECWLENVTIKTLRTRNSFARLYNCLINNDDTSLSALRLLNGITIIMGNSRVTPLNDVSDAGTALITSVGGHLSINPSGLILNEQTNYYYGLEVTSGSVIIADTLLQLFQTYSVNGNKYTNADIPTLTSN